MSRSEAELPSFADKLKTALNSHIIKRVITCATSLAAARDLHVTCTPWLGRNLHQEEMGTLFNILKFYQNGVPYESVCNALYFGHGTMTQVEYFLVFPHTKRDLRKDVKMLEKWHDKVHRPAFQNAWAQVREGRYQFEQPDMPTFECCRANSQAHREADVRDIDLPIHLEWPSAKTRTSKGRKGTDILDDAWHRMKKIVANDPELEDLRDMVLAVVVGKCGQPDPNAEDALKSAKLEQALDVRFLIADITVVFDGICVMKNPFAQGKVDLNANTRHLAKKRKAGLARLEGEPEPKRAELDAGIMVKAEVDVDMMVA